MPKLKKFLLIIISLAGFFLFKAPTSTKAQQPDINCIGQSVANYMNTVIAGTRNLSNIRLLSPAFNMTSPYFHPIINAMAANGANFSGLNAIAGNSYNTTGNTITGYTAQAMSNSNIAGMPVFLTEIGMYEITQGTPKATALQNLQNEIAKIKNNNPVFFVAANLFNSFGTNRDPQFQYNVMSDTEIATVCGGPCGKIGINFATYYGTASQGDYQRAANLGMTYTLEIAQNNPQSIIQIINSLPSGIIPVIRIGVGTDSGGFTDPNVYVQFLQTVNAGVSRPFYAIAGPNEPESEPWASQNCTPGPPPPGGTTPPPQITPYIPVRYDCNETNSPEFHSLRPYPASMCDQRLLQVSSYCGNDILIKENFEVRPSNINTQGYDSVQCTGTPEIGQQCTVTTTTSTNFSIDFRDAELPIMGNTQLVPNPYNRGNPWPENLTYEKRVNNYISWYINGTIYRAEEPPLDIQNSTSDLNKLINFSGPINKLLPEKVARWYRKYRYLGASVGGDYHNQTVACTKNNRIVPCDGSSGLTEERLSGVQGAIPMEENYPTYQDFQNAYSAWSSSLDRILSYYIPMKTTEDRPGMATVSGLFTEPVSLFEYPGGENPVDSAEVVSRNISINHDFLYFSHMAEVADLATLPMKTYLPANFEITTQQPGGRTDPADSDRCDLENVRWNSGDDLYGEVVDLVPNYVNFGVDIEPDGDFEPNPKILTGSTAVKSTFTCDFPAWGSGTSCYDNCIFCPTPTPAPTLFPGEPTSTPGPIPPSSCLTRDQCLRRCEPRCKKVSYAAPYSMYTVTPRVKDVWERLIDLQFSIYKRLHPKIGFVNDGINSLVFEILNLPGVTTVHYTETSNNPNVNVLGGAPRSQRPGERAEIYIPHLGGLYEYFLLGIQYALRPLGVASRVQGSPPPLQPPPPNICSEGTSWCSVTSLLPYFGNDTAKATKASQICQAESGSNPNAINDGCLRGTSVDYSVGLFQINLLAHCLGAFSSFTWNPPSCTVANQSILDACVQRLLDPTQNILEAYRISSGGTNWSAWSTAAVCRIQ